MIHSNFRRLIPLSSGEVDIDVVCSNGVTNQRSVDCSTGVTQTTVNINCGSSNMNVAIDCLAVASSRRLLNGRPTIYVGVP